MLRTIFNTRDITVNTVTNSLVSRAHRQRYRSRSYHKDKRTPDPVSPELAQLLETYAQQELKPINLATLLSFGRPLTKQSILLSAAYVLSEIPRRIVRPVRSLESLPYIVGTNPFITRILQNYRKSFQRLATYPEIKSLKDNAIFATHLEALVQAHANDIPIMAKGFQESARYMTSKDVGHFLDGAITNRIAIRLIAEQHIALSRAFDSGINGSDHHGILNNACSPNEMIRSTALFVAEMCEATLGASPSLLVDGQSDATFAYIPVHLQYILTELLKNAFRATVEHHFSTSANYSASSVPPVLVTISPHPRHHPGAKRDSFLSLRVRDQGGGILPVHMAKIFSYAFTTAGRKRDSLDVDNETGGGPYAAQYVGGAAAIGNDGGDANLFGEIAGKGLQTGIGTIAGLGYGLPMSRLYAKYFGGNLELHSLDGWGTDVFLRLRYLDEAIDVEI